MKVPGTFIGDRGMKKGAALQQPPTMISRPIPFSMESATYMVLAYRAKLRHPQLRCMAYHAFQTVAGGLGTTLNADALHAALPRKLVPHMLP